MTKKYDFLFPDGYIYTKSLNPKSTLADFITEVRGAIFKEDQELFDNSIQRIKIFYAGVFLNNEFTFSEIKYSALKIYIKPTPEAHKAKSQHYKDLLTIGFKRKEYTDDEKDERIIYEDNMIRNEVTNEELNQLKPITPSNFPQELMILYYLEVNDIQEVEKYFKNVK